MRKNPPIERRLCEHPPCGTFYQPKLKCQRYCSRECHDRAPHTPRADARRLVRNHAAEFVMPDRGAPKCEACYERLGFGTDGDGRATEYCKCGTRVVLTIGYQFTVFSGAGGHEVDLTGLKNVRVGRTTWGSGGTKP